MALVNHDTGINVSLRFRRALMKKIYVGNLAYNTNEQELEGFFGTYGEIVHLKLVRDFATGKSKGFCFIEFATPDQAQAALDSNGKDLQGRSLKVSLAREQQGGGNGGARSGGGFRGGRSGGDRGERGGDRGGRY